MRQLLDLSVVIPTYDRPEAVRRLLASLADQSLPAESYEVIVVDDGSPQPVHDVIQDRFPFRFRFMRIPNSGATRARNYGAERSQGHVIVFVDDDVTLTSTTLDALLEASQGRPKRLVTGRLVDRIEPPGSVFARVSLREADTPEPDEDQVLPFTACNTQLLAVRRDDFFELGMLEDPTGGWPNWDDVDFGYRAYRASFSLVQCSGARGDHWDYALGDLHTASRRWEQAAWSATRLFRRHPELEKYLPMFRDKSPVDWRQDSPILILRKLARWLAGSRVALRLMLRMASALEAHLPFPKLLQPIYRWVIGGYTYQGYRRGLRELRSSS